MGHIKYWLDIFVLWGVNIWARVIDGNFWDGLTRAMTLQNMALLATFVYTVIKIFIDIDAWIRRQRAQRRSTDGN